MRYALGVEYDGGGFRGWQRLSEAGALAADGSLDRAALGALVFGDTGARETLNDIIHPRVRAEAARTIEAAPPDAVIVQDIPLLVETGQGDAFPLVVVVEAPGQARLRRMVEQRGMSEADARARMAAQATGDARAAVADVETQPREAASASDPRVA